MPTADRPLTMALFLLILATLVMSTDTRPDWGLRDATAIVGRKFEYQLGDKTFRQTYNISKVIERGYKKLPVWLSYDTNSSLLVGVPLEDDVGTVAIRMKAVCADTTSRDCPDRISRSFRISVFESLTAAERAAPDDPPVLTNPIEELQVHVGRYFEFQVPTNAFNDTEDGNTRNLSISARLVYGKPLPAGTWLKFNETRQTFYGIPLWQDVQDMTGMHYIATVTLIAMDSAGQVAKDVIPITYNKSHLQGHTHTISVTFNDSFTKFNKDRENLVDLGRKLAGFYGDTSLKFITFLKLMSGSVVCVWSNNSLSVNVCCKDEIQAVFNKLVDSNESVTEELVSAFHPTLNPVAVELEFVGICLLPPTTLVPPTKATIQSDNSSMWMEIILPILIAVLVLVIIILILLVFCRHKRPRKESGKDEKSNFLEDRRPIIFPEELEMVDPSLKAKQPLVLPSDYIAEVPPVPPHKGKDPPTYTTPAMDDELFGDPATMDPTSYGSTGDSDPPPYRLPPPYFNPHRNV